MADGIRINLQEKFAAVSQHWRPALVDTIDGYDIKIVKLLGDFVWHKHAEEDELFVVLNGSFRMDFRDRQVALHTGEMIVVQMQRTSSHPPTPLGADSDWVVGVSMRVGTWPLLGG